MTIRGLALCAWVAAWAADNSPPPHVKTGLWEITTITATSEELPLPAGLLERLTPEQRARLDERLKARASESAKTAVAKRCLTTNELSKGFPFGPRRMSCTRTAVNSSNNKVDLSVECMDNGLKTDGTLEIEALNPENVKGVLQLAVTGGDPSTNSSSTFSARWLGSVCSAIK